MTTIYVDADGCPVKNEVYRVAKRYKLNVILVANSRMWIPEDESIHFQLVDDGFDAADDWIAEHAQKHDIAITGDIPLAARCLKNGAHVIGPKGRIFTEESIGDALATREILSQLRDAGTITGGPQPFSKRDRSEFLQSLDRTIHACNKERLA